MDLRLHSSLTRVLAIEDTSQVGHARRIAQKLAEQLGFDATDSGRVALVVTEVASNILKHASNGELHLRALPGAVPGVEVIAIDRGQGFDLDDCMADGFSTRGTQGIGLGAMLRQAQVFDVHSDNRGTVVLTRFYPRQATVKDVRLGVSQHSLHDDPACGDAWEVAITGQQLSILVIDGLGHGPEAESAAKAGTLAFGREPFADPTLLLEEIHHEMRGTRGGAVAIAQFDGAQDRLRFIGIGNIGATLIGEDKPRGLASHPGIVGLQYRKVPPVGYPQSAGQLLIMYSDGLQSRWNLRDYPGLMYRHPAIIAAVLHRDFCRGRDDVTVLVMALETLDD
ncbi:ATP-binding protein [Pseudomonas sp. SLFW]|uniref:ATP-binding protein n=1 Tax=Pseudomonas sp. SLFW TaxID=2683259 RepID=UPI001411E09F|nr:ATP-binding protein [Pseudomonas sp. SLFW]NBB12987.1 SpoIIE family protein phosphatase [Pseudomonas sp. SLFW]